MENPLHERLRVTESFGSSWCLNMEKVTPDIIDTDRCDSKVCGECFAEWAEALADEIERDYVIKEQHDADIARIVEAQENGAHNVIKTWAEHNGMTMLKNETITEWLDRWTVMRPRFDDGEPVPGNHEDDRVSYYYVYDDGSWVMLLVGEDGSDIEEISGHADEHVKLAVHKVYDADGVEIKVGDTVWDINNGCEHEVICLPKQGCYQSVEIRNVATGSKGGIDAPLLTHDRPVFDADGERIRNGDTVWHIKTGRELKVLSPHGYGECTYDCVNCFGFYPKPSDLTHERPVFDAEGVRIRNGDTVWTKAGIKREVAKVGTEPCEGMEEWDGSPWVMFTNGSWMHSKDVTNREPDSLAKLRYDIIREDRTRGMSCVHVWADRITALMEGGA